MAVNNLLTNPYCSQTTMLFVSYDVAGGSTVSVVSTNIVTAVSQRPVVEASSNMMSILNTSSTTGVTTTVTEATSDAPKISKLLQCNQAN